MPWTARKGVNSLSNYTTEVRYICEVAAGLNESEGYSSVDTIINKAIPKIFDFSFPIYDESYRNVLQRKIIKHYYTREIAAETVGLWKHFLDRRLNEIMPYYNKLYQSELFNFNPLYDIDLTTTHTRTGSETGQNEETKQEGRETNTTKNSRVSTTSEKEQTNTENTTTNETGTISDAGTNTNTKTLNTTTTSTDSGTEGKTGADIKKNTRWDIYSDTPQGSLSNIKTGDGAYLTNARNITDDGTGSSFNETTTFGKINTNRETGTVSDSGTTGNLRTLDTTTETDVESRGNEELSANTQETETIKNAETIDNNSTAQHNINTTEDYIQHVTGKNGTSSYAKMLLEYRDTLLNIDTMIINELSDLFFNLW